MLSILITALFSLSLGQTSAAASSQTQRPCIDLEIPVKVKANNSIYDAPHVESTIDAVDWSWNQDTWSSPNASERVTAALPVDQTFAISGRLCVPVHAGKTDIVQIATHGVGVGKR